MDKCRIEDLFRTATNFVVSQELTMEEVNDLTSRLIHKQKSLFKISDIITQEDVITSIKNIVPSFDIGMTRERHGTLKRLILNRKINCIDMNNAQLTEKNIPFSKWDERDTLIDELATKLLHTIDNELENKLVPSITEASIVFDFNQIVDSELFINSDAINDDDDDLN